ncbi:MAG: PAS domain-containing protein [bacterium]|nr:PAS domain-containing protein [bacterium]
MSADLARLDAILGSVSVGILAVDSDGRVELQNPEASRILGVSAVTTLGRTLEECLIRTHPAVSLIRQALEEDRELSEHAIGIPSRLGGEELLVDLSVSPVGVGHETAGAVLSLHDRTIGLELEDLIDQHARSELFAQLAAGIAHELRNPLGGIRGSAELLIGKLEDRALLRFPELIRDETDRMRRLLDDLAELTHSGDLNLRPTNLHRVMDDLIDLQAPSEGWETIEVQREYDVSIPDIELDSDRFTQVVLNLVRNAVQAMGGKGRLTLRTRVDASYQVSRDQPTPVRMVRVEVEDTGSGIPPEDLPHIFTPFFTQRVSGSGLGLAIAQHWTVRHGGRIQVSSNLGEGTRMRVYLPLSISRSA